jgi:hypothetical protein
MVPNKFRGPGTVLESSKSAAEVHAKETKMVFLQSVAQGASQ